jgi:cytochrome b6
LSIFEKIARTQLWRSIFRHGYPDNPRDQTQAVLSNVFLHIHPVRVRKSGVRLTYTWCMGGLSFFLFLVEAVTGCLLMFYYRPSVGHAYLDTMDLGEQVPLGILRELHRWGAHAMVITVFLHMLRVFLTGSYKPPREFNWVVGVGLLVLTLLLSFTGYLLPWDQLSLWAVTVGSNMAASAPVVGSEGPARLVGPGSDLRFLLLGGETVGESALLRFYVLHCIAIPLGAAVLLAVHFWRIRKDGGISGPL